MNWLIELGSGSCVNLIGSGVGGIHVVRLLGDVEVSSANSLILDVDYVVPHNPLNHRFEAVKLFANHGEHFMLEKRYKDHVLLRVL